MSTEFEVYPGTAQIPTFGQLLDRANAELHRFLASLDIAARPVIQIDIHKKADHQPVLFALTDPLVWPEDCYAWFTVDGIPGGTDAYWRTITDGKVYGADIREILLEAPRGAENRRLVEKCLEQDYYWSFRRSAGQPDTIRLAYGLIAGSLADLTSGLVYSDDGAWDYHKMPATASDFLSYYFVPDPATDHWNAWVQHSIDRIVEAFKG